MAKMSIFKHIEHTHVYNKMMMLEKKMRMKEKKKTKSMHIGHESLRK